MVVTTGIGFRGWVEAADAAGLAEPLVEMLRGTRIVARDPRPAARSRRPVCTADWVAESETSAEIAEVLLDEGVAGHATSRCSTTAPAPTVSTTAFAAAGARVAQPRRLPLGAAAGPGRRRRRPSAPSAAGEIDAVVFTSAPGAARLARRRRRRGRLRPASPARLGAGSVVMAAVGPVTAKPLLDRGIDAARPRPRSARLAGPRAGRALRSALTSAVTTGAGPLQVRRTVALLDGHVLPVSPNGLEVLRLLAAAGGDVVPRDQVLDALPGDSRDPHAAEVAIARLREASGSRALIQTVVKRGYRLTVP